MKKSILLLLFFSSFVIQGFCGEKSRYKKIYLWQNVRGMEVNVRDTILFAPKDTAVTETKKAAVVICPGGSYHHLGMPHEGFASAKWFRSVEVVPFVLQYRVAYNCHHHPAMLEDIEMAIKYIRENADDYGIDINKVGAIGYSAGGHLVTMAGVYGGSRNELEKIGVPAEVSLRPNFVMPIYPVVTMQDDICHIWSRRSLLGHREYTQELKDEYSMELNIPDDMVPTYILACRDDPVVIFENSVRLEKSLAEKNIPHRFAVYEKGGHGFGMKDGWFMKETHWNEDLRNWLEEMNIIN
ncbi:alpha/beta hydrolase [Treponema sp.]|uniref:alpha/beta hydrolase n=1 Tax=Treponema sp. TaxID=166 RepID=UPI00298E8AFB|nr:alpha/beta hydrolase [Treponema sp.]MCI6442198.1 alpha/beta hydrolase [Spirochaetia bacterium]MDY4133461.1 alpha/beta hydrolase [Treponema sp.]